MSDTPQGPGWWIASDGKYYPPQPEASAPAPAPVPPAAPAYQPQAQAQPSPMYQPQPPPVPPQGAKKGHGCLWAFLIVSVLIVVLVVGGFFVVRTWFTTNVASGDCAAISQKDAEDAMGGKVTVLQLGSLTTLGNLAVDSRILPEAKSCLITSASNAGQARVAKIDVPDAAAAFQTELKKAKGGSSTPSSTTTTSPDVPDVPAIPGFSTGTDYFLKDVSLGNEAFCTKADILNASGVLVRKGNTLVYAAIAPATGGSSSTSSNDASEANCALAQKLAAKAL